MAQCMVDGGGQSMQVIRIGEDIYRIQAKNKEQSLSSNGGHSVNRRKAQMRIPSHRKSYGVTDEAETTACEAEFRNATAFEEAQYNHLEREECENESEEEDEEEAELLRQLTHARESKPYQPTTASQVTSAPRSLPYRDSLQSTSTASHETSSHNISDDTQEQVPQVVTMKRQYRLYKNREAAKECRRKKKDYVHCLENRVVVLENQNKTLIAELKTLKELYTQSE